MEYQRVFYRSSFNVSEFMLDCTRSGNLLRLLKGESMNYEDRSGCRSRRRYQPVEIKILTSKADKRYYKLHNGDILDLDTKTILDRQSLRTLLDA